MLPITRSLADLQISARRDRRFAGQLPDADAYQADVVACALFLTGQASNPLAARQAAQLTEHVPGGAVVLSYGNWLWCLLAIACS
jgi:di/tricarboxylate transporter